jgi:hypothetical protein
MRVCATRSFWPLVVALALSAVLALALAAPAGASGGSLSGALVYNNMGPASRVLVLIAPAHATGTVQIYETITNGEGEWSCAPIPAGEYSVAMIVEPASGVHETRATKTVQIEEGEAVSLGTVTIGEPAVSEARTQAEVLATGTLSITVTTAEGLPAGGAQLEIQSERGGEIRPLPASGTLVETLRNGPVSISVTDTPPDGATEVSASMQATVTAGRNTAVALTLPPSPTLAVPSGTTAANGTRDLGYLNAERARWGLPAGLTLDRSWSQACAAHDTYMADNHVIDTQRTKACPVHRPAAIGRACTASSPAAHLGRRRRTRGRPPRSISTSSTRPT